ncbi:class I ribonucleotide reductase maintenance protein YfaE [Alcaligenes sp. SDU_A2]|uniref:class I ribonucleotide reductase maintenance protein YfaE n=1 Tax=Alcaligenes sp. SDU_A2 TaxID=3136634 RepID=UPI002B80F4AA|nr:class I ribonucleotide reductase maintenance protein YfaE [Alcaligenes sp.]HRL27420.1 class I ribonucleotide reductase maintenance protein YfaE [Alcaligenes sp.]
MSLVRTTDTQFRLLDGETLLEGLERTGHQVEYQCRSGYCGSCRIPLVYGQVTYKEQPLAYVAPGEVLPCCCTAAEPISVDCQRMPKAQEENEGQLSFSGLSA